MRGRGAHPVGLLPAEHVTGGVQSVVPFLGWLSAVRAGAPVPTAC